MIYLLIKILSLTWLYFPSSNKWLAVITDFLLLVTNTVSLSFFENLILIISIDCLSLIQSGKLKPSLSTQLVKLLINP